MYYELLKVIIKVPSLAKVIINIIMQNYSLSDSIISNYHSVFTIKFGSSLRYFLEIKRKLLNVFHPQTNSLTKKYNSAIKVYFQAFVSFEQNDGVRLLSIAEFDNNISKTLAPIIYFLNSTAAINYTFSIRKILILDRRQNQ